MSANPARNLCLGDALVDMVGEHPGTPLTEIGHFSPHFGGAAANVALVKAGAKLVVLTLGGGEPARGDGGGGPGVRAVGCR